MTYLKTFAAPRDKALTVLVFGGRKFDNENAVRYNLTVFQQQIGRIQTIIHGDAPGADKLSARIAWQEFGILNTPYPAEWGNIERPGAVIKYGKYGPYDALAGHVRNQRMLDAGKPHWGIMFPGGTGTADMLSRLEAAKIPVWRAVI